MPVRIRVLALAALLAAVCRWVAPAGAGESGGHEAQGGPVAGGIRLEGAPAPDLGAAFTELPAAPQPVVPKGRTSGAAEHGETLRTRGDLLREGFRLLLK